MSRLSASARDASAMVVRKPPPRRRRPVGVLVLVAMLLFVGQIARGEPLASPAESHPATRAPAGPGATATANAYLSARSCRCSASSEKKACSGGRFVCYTARVAIIADGA